MSDAVDRALQALRHAVHSDATRQERLFAVEGSGDFVVAVRQLAQSLGHELEEEDVRQAMYTGRQAWSERHLP